LTAALRRGPEVTGNPAPITTRTMLMNSSNDVTSQKVEAREVANDERMQMLPRHFGRDMLTVENAVYAFMRKLTTQYTGGYWTFMELSNGGCYLAPQSEACSPQKLRHAQAGARKYSWCSPLRIGLARTA
jgi:hypothetical protein